MAKKKPDTPEGREAEIRAHGERLGLSPAFIAALIKLLLAFPALIAPFLARKPKMQSAPSPDHAETVKDDSEAIFAVFEDASETDGQNEVAPGKFGGPLTQGLLVNAFNSLLDMAERNVDAAAALLDRLINRFVATP